MKKRRENIKDKESALTNIINWAMSADDLKIDDYVSKLRKQNRGISNYTLAKKILNRRSFKCGLIGAITGVGGVLTLPVSIPSDLAFTWKIQSVTAIAIAYVYGHTAKTTDLKTDIYIIMAGNAAKEALKRVGIETSKSVTKKAIQRYITREIMKKIWKVVGRKIITKAGQKSLTSFMKMIPLVGAPVGFIFDYVSARIVGNFAIKYYSGGG